MKINSSIFKAYDIRGIYPDEIDEETAYMIGKAYSVFFNVKKVVVGRDVRVSSPALKDSLVKGLIENGVDVIDIGVVSTDMMYFATVDLKADGGITVSASHNPREYNGMKMVIKDAFPVSSDSGILQIRDLILNGNNLDIESIKGSIKTHDILDNYIQHIRSFVDLNKIKPMKIVTNGNFGMAGTVVQELLKNTPIELIQLNENPDGKFPKGRPDPLIAENRAETENLIKAKGADFGVAWDADADRCFFFDEKGEFIQPYFITALLSKIILRDRQNQSKKVICDPRLVMAIKEEVEKAGGETIVYKVGHSFIKKKMRDEDAIFAGESSAHYYFKDNYYCDNGMIPFMLILQELSQNGKKISELVSEYKEKYFTPGEINFTVNDGKKTMSKVKNFYMESGKFNDIDGVTFDFDKWRFNLRGSNTEPLIRLNIESTDKQILEEKIKELSELIKSS